jgi:hypothetical protein
MQARLRRKTMSKVPFLSLILVAGLAASSTSAEAKHNKNDAAAQAAVAAQQAAAAAAAANAKAAAATEAAKAAAAQAAATNASANAAAADKAAREARHDAIKQERIAEHDAWKSREYQEALSRAEAANGPPPPPNVAWGIKARMDHLRRGMGLTANPTVRQEYSTEAFRCERLLKHWDGKTIYTNP